MPIPLDYYLQKVYRNFLFSALEKAKTSRQKAIPAGWVGIFFFHFLSSSVFATIYEFAVLVFEH